MSLFLKWFPPSWLQIKTDRKVLYIDPAYLRTYYARYPKKIEFSRWPDTIDGLPEELEKGDVILVTHSHKDHCKRVTINRLKRSNTLVIAPETCLKELDREMNLIRPGDVITVGDIKITAVEAYNTPKGSSTRKVHRKGRGVGYLLSIKGRTIYHAGDTDFFPEMKELGKIDVALLPIGGTFTMDMEEAVKTVLAIQPEIVIPMHYLKSDPQRFKGKIEEKSDIRVVVLQIGESYQLR